MQNQSSAFRTWHRWLSLIVGVQMLIWAVSGAYMVFVKLPFIHGEHLTQEADGVLHNPTAGVRIADVIATYPDAYDVKIVNRTIHGERQDVAQVHSGSDKFLVNLNTLAPIQLAASDIRTLAMEYYKKGDNPITNVELLTENPPTELSETHLPIWRVDFDDFGNTSLYLHQATGEMTVRRHDFWRGFDIMWMLHIMDYEDRVDITTWWLRAFIFGTFLFAFTGSILVVQTLRSNRRKPI